MHRYSLTLQAEALRARLGVREGDRVAVAAGNSYACFEILLAAAAAGAIVVPINIRWCARLRRRCLRLHSPVALEAHSSCETTGVVPS